MQEYRAYILDADGQVNNRIEFRAPDDQTAAAHARQYLDRHDAGHHDAEVWLTRIVARLIPTAH